MSNIIDEFSDIQKFDPKGWDTNNNGEALVKGFDGNVLWSAMQLPSALSTVNPASAPPTEVAGDIYILYNYGTVHADWDGASKNDIVYFDGTDWLAITPVEGQSSYDKERNCMAKFKGTDWILDNCEVDISIGSADLITPAKVDLIEPICPIDIIDVISVVEGLIFDSVAYTGSGVMEILAENNTSPIFAGTNACLIDTDIHYEKMLQKNTEEIVMGDKIQALVNSAMSTGDGEVRLILKYRIIKG